MRPDNPLHDAGAAENIAAQEREGELLEQIEKLKQENADLRKALTALVNHAVSVGAAFEEWECGVCSKRFSSRVWLREHIDKNHPEQREILRPGLA